MGELRRHWRPYAATLLVAALVVAGFLLVSGHRAEPRAAAPVVALASTPPAAQPPVPSVQPPAVATPAAEPVKPEKPKAPTHATRGAEEAVLAIGEMCEEYHADRDQSIMRRANQYLLDEARDRPTLDIEELLLDAIDTMQGGLCATRGSASAGFSTPLTA
jgi:uncharacterized iron-regulated membrane protein